MSVTFLLTTTYLLVHHSHCRPILLRFLQSIVVLFQNVVKDRIIVAQIETAHTKIDRLHMIDLFDASFVVFDGRMFQAFRHESCARREIFAHAVEYGEAGIFDSTAFADAFLLNADSKIVTVFNSWNVHLNPHFDCTQKLHRFGVFLFDDVHHSQDSFVA